MKMFKFFALCGLLIALLAAPFAVFASPLFGTNFDSSFTGDHAGWTPISGAWNLEGQNYYVSTSPGWHAIRHNGLYTNFIYQARIMRTGCDTCTNGIVFRASGAPSDSSDWSTGYYFDYRNTGYFVIYKQTNGTFSQLVPWTLNKAIKRNGINKLKVVVNGSSLQFFINDTLVAYGNDTSIAGSGQVGIEFYGGGLGSKPVIGAAINKFYVDWARLTLGSSSMSLPANVAGAINLADVQPQSVVSDRSVAP